MLEHHFDGTPFTIGIEEELMICDAESLELAQAIEVILGDLPHRPPQDHQLLPGLGDAAAWKRCHLEHGLHQLRLHLPG